MPDDPYFEPTVGKGGGGCLGRLLHVAIVGGIILLLIALLLPFSRGSGRAVGRAVCVNNLKQILIALHNYHQEYGSFPPAFTTDATGRRLHSWRTLILPFLEENPVYRKVDFTRPWDDPANASALSSMPRVYRCPDSTAAENMTCYLAFLGRDYAFSPDGPRKIDDFTDGTSNTVMLIDAPDVSAVPWMSPRDGDMATMFSIRNDAILHHPGGTNLGMADGSVRFMKASADLRERLVWLTLHGGEAADLDKF